MSNTTFIFLFVFIAIASLIFMKNSGSDIKYNKLKDNAVILSFGDSLTYGFGAEYGFSYPDYLEKKIGLRVINEGINGELSSEGLLRLPLLLEQKPDLVILCHVGNDILNKISSLKININ